MKQIALILLFLTLTTAGAFAKDFHLVQTQMLDSEEASDGSSKAHELLTVYVLVMPDGSRPKVFKTFDSKAMEGWLSDLPRGSVVFYDANAFLPAVQPAKLTALKTSCQKKGVSLMESPVD